ncbi:sugar ABC transporter permease [Lichenihabitans sp. Uapishka_5]|uniref:carbohydrate ABC transporter permease n=1 Tax=Lichenihabitans sp. Uapishka_5 TaxID=3037302 RepID=UPI0029E7FD6D|nr:sugar ABC transporter permease [Lichenihabitans sp. Uapishka_5]MDX7951341.1 sugar ABC transporter permease [Lichenihabitans sp. Uapishka_5]
MASIIAAHGILPRRDGLVLIAPLTLFLLAMLGLPFAIDIVYALSHVTFENIRHPQFEGLGNFATVLRDPAFWQAMWFSLRFALLTATAQLVIGLGLAIFLAPLFALIPSLMAILMLPMMMAPALVGLMYRLLLQEFVGIVPNTWAAWFGDSPAFLSPGTAFWTLSTIEILQWTPFALLILYSAYAAIPGEIREAAALDGAGPLRRLVLIDLPWMAPTLAITFFFRFIDGFRVFDNVYVLTGTGAGGSTTTISIFIYEAFFRHNDIGVAVAASLILLALSFAVLTGLMRLAGGRR